MSFSTDSNRIEVAGSLDRYTLANVSAYKYPNLDGDVVVDLAKVEHTDTAGLAWVLKLIAHYQKKHQVELINQPEQLLALASISNVIELLPIKK